MKMTPLRRALALALLLFVMAILSAPATAEENGVITNKGSSVNLRSGPGIGYPALAQLSSGQPIVILARVPDWVQVRAFTLTGWVNARYVASYTPPVTVTLPTEAPRQTYNGIVNAVSLNVRNGPGPYYGIIAQALSGDAVNVLGGSADGAWLLIRLQNTQVGWVEARYVDVSGAMATNAPPTLAPPSTAVPQPTGLIGLVTASRLNLRNGPGPYFGIVGKLSSGTAVSLLGRNWDASWVLVSGPGGLSGWASAEFISVNFPLFNLPQRG
jgi:N-acetylmuramoyl-L-alanine amidase